jgi:hypothetical protein
MLGSEAMRAYDTDGFNKSHDHLYPQNASIARGRRYNFCHYVVILQYRQPCPPQDAQQLHASTPPLPQSLHIPNRALDLPHFQSSLPGSRRSNATLVDTREVSPDHVVRVIEVKARPGPMVAALVFGSAIDHDEAGDAGLEVEVILVGVCPDASVVDYLWPGILLLWR